jgi:hypothetical protein
LKQLRDAAATASQLGQDIWQFAVEIGQLHAEGLSNTHLRHLLFLGYVEHSQERTPNGAYRRFFKKLETLSLPERTCFVVTEKGWKAAAEEIGDPNLPVSLPGIKSFDVPRWDGTSRQLWWKGLLIKEFHRPACNQETVLAAFEEEGWPLHIDDPLPRTPDIDPKVRLHDTIKYLNRNQLRRAICFRGDGRARGILWMVEESS